MYVLEGGVAWTPELRDAFKHNVTRASVLHNNVNYNEDNFLKEAELQDVRYVPNVGFLGQAVAKMLTIRLVNDENSNLNFENANIQFKIGAEYNNNVYYINFGNFIVIEPPENDDTNGTVKVIAYDYMIKFNKNYINRVVYPCTLKDLLLDVCSQAGVELGSDTFLNENFIVEDNQFEGKQLREVLQHIAKSAFSWARIGQDNKLYLDFQVNNNIDETITIDEYKMDAFKKANEYYGPINKVTYADSDIKGQEISVQDDNSIALNGVKEIIIYDNYFAYTTEKRQQLIQAGTALFGLRYMPIQKLETIGLIYLDSNDIMGIEDGKGTTFLTRNFSHIIKYNGMTNDTFETTGESDNQRTYVNQNNSATQNARTEIIVDRAKKEITAVIEEVGEQNQKIAEVRQTVDELSSQISDIADITTSLETTTAKLQFEDINQSEPIRVVIHPIGVNIAKLHPSSSLHPSTNLKITTRILRFQNTTTSETFDYEIPDDLLYYDSENYDEFILDYESLSCVINKKCKWNNDGTVGLLATTRTDEYEFPHIELTEGDYTVSLIKYSNGYLFARMMIKNYYTAQFATKAELNSEISQTVDNINLSVNQRLTNYSTTTQMNSAIDLKANQITSSVSETYATKSELNSSTSSLNSKIDQTASSISLTVDNIQEQVETAQSTAISAQSTANSATTKANNAQTSANNAQATADSINTNLTTNYYTKTQTNSAINQKADSITSTVSQTYSTKTETTAAKNAAINSANASTDTKLQSYSTTTQMNSAIEQKADQITSSVSATYSKKSDSVTSVDVQYALSTSTTTAPTSGWSTTAPTWQQGKYMWQRTITNYADGTSETSNPTCIAGAKGDTGSQGGTGATGTGVSAVIEQYYLSTSNTSQTGGSWQTTQPTWSSGKYIWTRSKITWTNNTTTYTTPILASSINKANETANNVVTNFGTYIEQNTEHVKVAWNQISEYIQMMIINNNASFAILDSSKKPIAYFDKTGIHFSSNNTAFGEMGVQTVDGNKFIAFSVDGTYGSTINNGMAWGIKTTSDNKFHPIFYIKNFEMSNQESDASFGELVLSASNLLLDGIGTGLITGGVKIFGDPTAGGMYFYDVNANKYLLQIYPENTNFGDYGEIVILDNISFNKVSNGENRLFIGPQGTGCQLSDNGYISGSMLYINDGGATIYGGATITRIY